MRAFVRELCSLLLRQYRLLYNANDVPPTRYARISSLSFSLSSLDTLSLVGALVRLLDVGRGYITLL